MSTLKVPGARLSYEVSCSGPLMILVPGSAVVGVVYLPQTCLFSVQYQVVTGCSLGNSRSSLDRPADYDHRFSTNTDDDQRKTLAPSRFRLSFCQSACRADRIETNKAVLEPAERDGEPHHDEHYPNKDHIFLLNTHAELLSKFSPDERHRHTDKSNETGSQQDRHLVETECVPYHQMIETDSKASDRQRLTL